MRLPSRRARAASEATGRPLSSLAVAVVRAVACALAVAVVFTVCLPSSRADAHGPAPLVGETYAPNPLLIEMDEDGSGSGSTVISGVNLANFSHFWAYPTSTAVGLATPTLSLVGDGTIRVTLSVSVGPSGRNVNGTTEFGAGFQVWRTGSAGSQTIPIVDEYTVPVRLVIRPVNDPPVGPRGGQYVTTTEDTPVTFTVAASDPDGDPLTYSASAGAWGTVVPVDGTAGRFTYTPAPDRNGMADVTVTVSDGQSSTTIGVTVRVTSVPDPPVAYDQSVTTAEDSLLVVALGGSDPDSLGPLSFAVVGQAAHGILSPRTDPFGRVWTYQPAPEYSGTDSFTFTASDGTLTSGVATVSITISPVDDTPVPTSQTLTTDEDTPVTITLSATDVDTPGPLTFAVDATWPIYGGAVSAVEGDRVTFTPSPDLHGIVGFRFTASDGVTTSYPVLVRIAVESVDDWPAFDLATLPGLLTASTTDGATATVWWPPITATDPDSDESGHATDVSCLPGVAADPASGGTAFPVGTTWVTCLALNVLEPDTEQVATAVTTVFPVTVTDGGRPVLSVPSDAVLAEATGPNGATVDLGVTAIDAVDPEPVVACLAGGAPVAVTGAVLPLGSTTVTCTATDAAGNSSDTATVVVTVRDTTAPTVAWSGGPRDGGTYTAGAGTLPAAPTCRATDAADPTVACTVAGYSAAVGRHTLTATATDAAGHTTTAQRTYTVRPGAAEPTRTPTATPPPTATPRPPTPVVTPVRVLPTATPPRVPRPTAPPAPTRPPRR